MAWVKLGAQREQCLRIAEQHDDIPLLHDRIGAGDLAGALALDIADTDAGVEFEVLEAAPDQAQARRDLLALEFNLPAGEILHRHPSGVADRFGQLHCADRLRIDEQVDAEVQLVIDHRVVVVGLVMNTGKVVFAPSPLASEHEMTLVLSSLVMARNASHLPVSRSTSWRAELPLP